MISRRREGFVLIAVLWIIAALSVIGAVAVATARQGARAAMNRSDITTATWLAEGCTESVLAGIHVALDDSTRSQSVLWKQLPELRAVAPAEAWFGCAVEIEPIGARIDVNTAAPETVMNALIARGFTLPTADSMVAALQDWIDADTVARALGAEQKSSGRFHRRAPRNGPLQAPGELLMVRGFERDTALLAWFDVDPAAVVLDRAAPAVLSVLPGMSSTAVSWIMRQRAAGAPVTLGELAAALHGAPRDTMNAHFADLSSAVTDLPSRWRVVARVAGRGGVRVSVELIVARDDRRPVVLRRKVALE
jgi:hypothetical protein